MKFILLSCSLFGFLPVWSACADSEAGKPWGPDVLFLQGQTMPFFAGVMPFFHEEGRTLPSGAMNIHTSVLYFNTFRQDPGTQDPLLDLFLDIEGAAWSGEFRYSPSDSWELSLQLQALGTYSGVLDPFLSAFHRTFGFPNQSRELFPENQHQWRLSYGGKPVVDGSDGRITLTQASLAVKMLLPLSFSAQDRWALKFWAKPSIPTGSAFFLTDVWSLGAGILYSDRWQIPGWSTGDGLIWGLSGGLGLVQTGIWDLPVRPLVYFAGFHLGLVTQGWFWGAQGSLFQSPFRSGSYYVGYRAGEVHLGFKAPLGDLWWEAALVEELLTWGAMEVGFHAGVSWTF